MINKRLKGAIKNRHKNKQKKNYMSPPDVTVQSSRLKSIRLTLLVL